MPSISVQREMVAYIKLLWLADSKALKTHWIDFKSKSLFGLTSSTAGPECIHNLFGSTELRSEAFQMNHLVLSHRLSGKKRNYNRIKDFHILILFLRAF